MVEPSEEEIHFLKYPGSAFSPKESGYTYGINGFPKIVELVFKTTDPIEGVIAYFELVVKHENTVWEKAEKRSFQKSNSLNGLVIMAIFDHTQPARSGKYCRHRGCRSGNHHIHILQVSGV